jgi:uroporphyrinogen III methyltransferase/synthase
VAERALEGRRIVVTRPRRQALALAAELERLGAAALVVPLVGVGSLEDPSELDGALARLDRYEWIVFTSANGVAAVRDRLPAGTGLGGLRVAAVGPATAAAVGELGIEPAYVPERFEAAAIADGLGDLDGVQALLPQADAATPELATELGRRGALVDAVVAYRTVQVEPSDDELEELRTEADAVVVASGSAVRSVAVLVDRAPALRRALLVCIGPRTAEVAREVGLRVGLVADEASADGIIQALTTHFGEST